MKDTRLSSPSAVRVADVSRHESMTQGRTETHLNPTPNLATTSRRGGFSPIVRVLRATNDNAEQRKKATESAFTRVHRFAGALEA